jgi:branched-chain amino acid transport system substrate-binding protein
VVDARDDSSDPAKGEAAARTLAADKSVVGVVGTYNSGVAAKAAPVFARAGIAMVSPANTDPALTLGPDQAHPARPNANYFRMVASDALQAPFLATAALNDVKARTVAVVSETKPVSKGLADGFSTAFGHGGTVAFSRVVPDGTTDFADVAKTIASARPDLVFFGGEYDVGAAFTKQLSDAGVTSPVMGGDGIKDDAYITKAGPASDGDMASTVGAPLASQASAKSYVDAYARAGFKDPASDYGVYAYDGANIVIAAAAKALRGADAVDGRVRSAIVAAVQTTDTNGASGRVAFDKFGDTQTKVLTLYRVADGAWKPTKTEAVS